MADSRRPTRLAGTTKTGRMTRLTRVICQDRKNITTSTRATLMRLETIDESVSVKACWAPITSLLSRLMSAPVWVRVKKAMRHALDVGEHLRAHVVDEALADLGRHPADPDGEHGVDDGHAAGHQGQGDDEALVVADDALVDDLRGRGAG